LATSLFSHNLFLHRAAISVPDAGAAAVQAWPRVRYTGPHTSARRDINRTEEKAMKRKASAVWSGGIKDGKGQISTDSGVLDNTQYSFGTRFEDGKGTNPEELIAAAHAACFAMALSGQLGNAGMTADSISTTASVTLEKSGDSFAITSVHLDVTARIPGAEREAFEKAAKNAKDGCPVSKLLNASITMDTRLES
jgi:lipoyl-dependent peroxiredoxin